jgi:Dolichyl-phosphate-mannose-protein mannosyltransferase
VPLTSGPSPEAAIESMPLSRRREALLVAACIALFLVLAGLRAWDHAYPYYDDVAYLELGNQAREIGGPLGLLKALFSATWTEDNRHPLYAAVLSLVAGRDRGFHTRARILNLALGVTALLAWWRVARKHAGPKPALILAAFMAMSECFIDYSGRESCEPLLLLFWALAIGAILDGIDDPRRWVAAGAHAGLAQLDKGSGAFLVFGFAGALILWRGWRAISDRRAWAMGLAFVVVASPLLVRNVRLYGSPLHNFNNRLLWIDRLQDFAEIAAPGALDALPRGFRDWAAQTSWHEIWFGRGVMGIAETALHLGDSMSFVAPSPLGAVHIPGVVLGFALFVLALRILYKARRSFARTFLLTQAGLFVVFFFFYSVAAGSSRYVFPMTLSLYGVLAVALARHPVWLKRWSAAAATCVVLAIALDPSTRRPPRAYEEGGSWLERHLAPGDGYAVDSRSRFQPAWFLPRSTMMHNVSSTRNGEPLQPAELLPYFQRKGVRYVVIDDASNKGGAPRYFFFDHLPAQVPAGLDLVWSLAGELQIFELVSPVATGQSTPQP